MWSRNKVKEKTEDEFCDTILEGLKKIRQHNAEISHETDAHNKALRHMTKQINDNNKQINDVNRNINRLIR